MLPELISFHRFSFLKKFLENQKVEFLSFLVQKIDFNRKNVAKLVIFPFLLRNFEFHTTGNERGRVGIGRAMMVHTTHWIFAIVY